ncbi:hypothetical protein G7Z17_g2367 [Cylindrodendrum hubeiense]|uniref:Uncharacterized protein n=1 Tax=Cylindrodendrum hubeiense TaxID=595255 RepID=A0A9P5HEB1_9HYPO|nr:hypothetical protein G7Z17_g2367 [Cylindrodendrum hubeiense]
MGVLDQNRRKNRTKTNLSVRRVDPPLARPGPSKPVSPKEKPVSSKEKPREVQGPNFSDLFMALDLDLELVHDRQNNITASRMHGRYSNSDNIMAVVSGTCGGMAISSNKRSHIDLALDLAEGRPGSHLTVLILPGNAEFETRRQRPGATLSRGGIRQLFGIQDKPKPKTDDKAGKSGKGSLARDESRERRDPEKRTVTGRVQKEKRYRD